MDNKAKIGVELVAVVCVLCAVIALMRWTGLHFVGWESATFIGMPLVVAIILNLSASELGLAIRRPLKDLKFFGLACLVFLPPFVAGFYLFVQLAPVLLERFPSLAPFLRDYCVRTGQSGPGFLGRLGGEVAKNFLYLALTEEFLFRGYMQKRLSHITGRVFTILRFELPLAGVVCAALFAGAHLLYDGNIYRVFVFFPALIFAYLRYKTDSILAPTLFHGTCNVTAFVMGALLLGTN